jgi:hypothetical protein
MNRAEPALKLDPKAALGGTVVSAARQERWTAALVIALTAFIANYFLARGFGLYEDDYIWVNTLPPMGWPLSRVLASIPNFWRDWVFFQGRPIWFTIATPLAWFSGQFPSLTWSFAIGWLIHSTNGFLFFKVSRKVFSFWGSLGTALAYVTFFPDASKIILMHRTMYLAMTVLLVATLCYQSRRYILAYILALTAALIYECFYLPFLIAPFLIPLGQKLTWRRVLAHGALFFGLVAILVYLRSSLGDTRTTLLTSTGGAVIPKIILACLIGPATCFHYSLLTGPWNGLRETNWVFILITVVSIALFWFLVRRIPAQTETIPDRRQVLIRYGLCFAAGLLALAFAYCLAFRQFYYPPTLVIGRLSAVHMGAAFGWCVMLGAFISWLELSAPRSRTWLGAALLLYLGLAVNSGLVVQNTQYVASWHQQRAMWQQLVALRGNFQENDIILIDPSGFKPIEANPIDIFLENQSCDTLPNFIQFPSSWTGYPRVYGFNPAQGSWLVQQGLADSNVAQQTVRLHFPSWLPPSSWPVLRSGDFFRFRVENNMLIPSDQPLEICGLKLLPKHVVTDLAPGLRLTKVYNKVVVRSF